MNAAEIMIEVPEPLVLLSTNEKYANIKMLGLFRVFIFRRSKSIDYSSCTLIFL